MSPTERKALITLLVLGVVGHLLRAGDQPGALPGTAIAALIDPAADGDPLAHRDSSERLARPLAAGERIDADRADARHLDRLPGVGPALARRIVADRESLGAFGGIAGLDRVPGIGPATLARLSPHLTFSGVAAEASSMGSGLRLGLNDATAAELERLPGIGTARALAIVAFRDSAGPFRHAADLKRVPGIPDAVVDRLLPQLHPP
jgi:competence ComEA-like helix-hairpin-helix protein